MSNPDNKRSEYRLTDEFTVFIETQSSPQGDAAPPRLVIAKTVDISANGLQVSFDYPLILNSILRLCIDTHEGMRFILTGEIMRQTEIDGKIMIGFKLLDSDQTDIAIWKSYIAKRLVESSQVMPIVIPPVKDNK